LKAQLRIRETVSLRGKAGYKDVELGDGAQAPRGEVAASIVRQPDVRKGNEAYLDCLTFVPDTMHNRAKFISNSQVECSVYQDGTWVVLTEDWLDSMYAKAQGAKAVKQSSSSSSDQDLSARTDGYQKFVSSPKNKQLKALQDMMADNKIDMKQKVSLITRIVRTNDNRVPKTVREYAEGVHKTMESATA